MDRCMLIAHRHGMETDIEFSDEGGYYTAKFSNGDVIVGNLICPSVRIFHKNGRMERA